MAYKEALAVWKEGVAFDVTPDSGFTIHLDGDAQSGPSPMELVLMGLAGCTGADVIDILRKKRQNVASLEIKVHGNRTEEHPKRYTTIEVTFSVTGQSIDSEAVRRAIELSETKYCSVAASLKGVDQITTRFEIKATEPAVA
jgi:putative redox protein